MKYRPTSKKNAQKNITILQIGTMKEKILSRDDRSKRNLEQYGDYIKTDRFSDY